MDRRDFLKMSATAVAAPTFASSIGSPAEPKGAAAVMFSTLPCVHLLGADAVGILWTTSVKASGRVTWSQDGWATEHQAVGELDGNLDSDSLFHKAVACGIDLSKPLRYRVHSRRIAKHDVYGLEWAGEETCFESAIDAPLPPGRPLTWAMLNDIHGIVKIYDRFVPMLSDSTAMCILNGDVVESMLGEEKVEKWLLRPLSRISQEAHMPVWFLRGNHDTRGPLARSLRDYVMLRGGRYYSAVTLDGVRFAFADTGEDKEDSHPAYRGLAGFNAYLAREVEWAKREVASEAWKTARARIVVQHIPPPLAAGGWGPGLKRLDALNDVWKSANVTLMMSAHLHSWNWYDPWEGRPYPLVVGGGPYLGNPEQRDNATLTKCRLDGKTLTVKVLDQTGRTVIDKTIAV